MRCSTGLTRQKAALEEIARDLAQHDLRLAEWRDAWEGRTLEQKKTLLAEFIVKVTAYRKKGDAEADVEIVWRQGAREVKEALSVS